MESLNLKKVSVKSNGVTLKFEQGDPLQDLKATTFTSYDDPHPDLSDALDALCRVARYICEWPDKYPEQGMNITGVSFSYSESTEVRGAVITGIASLGTSTSPLCFNTPHLPFEQYSESGEAPLMPGWAIELLELVEVEAIAYLKGKRKQGDMFAEAA